jgi:Rrf2 family protein
MSPDAGTRVAGRQIPARIEYSVRALLALAVAEPATVTARVLADTQDIPPGYLYDVLADLRRADLVYAQRGSHGGYALTRPATEITVGGVIRLLDGTPADVRHLPAGRDGEDGPTGRLHRLWDAANTASLRLLDEVTLADLCVGPPKWRA